VRQQQPGQDPVMLAEGGIVPCQHTVQAWLVQRWRLRQRLRHCKRAHTGRAGRAV
jgi:hypothetical protein